MRCLPQGCRVGSGRAAIGSPVCPTRKLSLRIQFRPFSPTLLNNGSAVGDQNTGSRTLGLVRSEKDVDGSPLWVPFRLSPACTICHCCCWFKGCELFRVNDLHPLLVHRHVQIRINYPADGTSPPGKKKNEVLPLILVNVLFLATPGAIMEKKISWPLNHSSPFVIGARRQRIRGFAACCFSIVTKPRRSRGGQGGVKGSRKSPR